MKLSLVIPVLNEEDSIILLLQKVKEALSTLEHEVIVVDDGSRDNTVQIIRDHNQPHIRVIQFARNFGQTSAMAAGIELAEGEYIATLDGDLQNDPTDIPLMLEKLETEQLDLIAGYRANRHDNWLRTIPSKLANRLIRRMTKVNITDYGCTLKLFRKETAKNLDLYGELHRFIPILASINGARITEMEVKHHARQYGVSKYGLGRTFRVISDLLLMVFFIKYRQRPMHLFGTLGILSGLVGGAIEFYLLILKLMGEDIGGRPLFFIGILLIITSVQLIATGFIAELLMRTYFQSKQRAPYIISRQYRGDKEVV